MPSIATRSAATALGCCLLPAVSTADPEPDASVVMSFSGIHWDFVIETLVKMLAPARVEGEVPSCRVMLETGTRRFGEALSLLNSTYGLAFVQRDGVYTIHIPLDTERMCTVALMPP